MAERYDENTILAYVEGDLPAAERSAFERAMEQDAALRQLVEDMAGDRDGLRAMRTDTAPPGLVDAAIGHLERRLLLDPDPQAEESTILTGGPIPIRAAAQRRPMAKRWLAGLSVAAVLAISGAVMWQTLILPQESPRTQMADAGASTDADIASRIEQERPEPTMEASRAPAGRSADRGEDEDLGPRADAPTEAAPAEPPPVDSVGKLAGGGDLDDEYTDRSLSRAAPPTAAEMPSNDFAPTKSDSGFSLALKEEAAPEVKQAAPEAEPAKEPQPELLVRVATRSNLATERQVTRWALDNNAQIVRSVAPATATITKEAPAAMSKTAAPATTPAPRQQQVIVELAEPQVDELVDYLNKQDEQLSVVLHDNDLGHAGDLRRSRALDKAGQQIVTLNQQAQMDAETLQRPYEVDWDKLLEAQVPLAPVERNAPVNLTALPARRVRVLVELDETAAPVEAAEPADANADTDAGAEPNAPR